MCIQGSNQHIRRMVSRRVKVDDLADGMNAGVGSAAGVGMDSFAGEFGDGGFQSLLHGSKPRLGLPAEEVGAVVAQGQLNVAHGLLREEASCAAPGLRRFARRWSPPLCEDCPPPPKD